METKRCLNCDKLISETNFLVHELRCKQNTFRCGKCNVCVPLYQYSEHMEEHAKQEATFVCKCDQHIRVVERDEHLQVCPANERPCRWCDMGVLLTDYDAHSKQCGTRTEVCDMCHKRVMLKNMEVHLVVCSRNHFGLTSR